MTDQEIAALIANLLEMQGKVSELEAQQAALKQQLAKAIAEADGLRRKAERKKAKDQEK
jgi:hypothetical protein